jgi:site-specific DNA-methyltransferase (adenine-specific)
MLEINHIYNADCLEVMKNIEDKSIDCIICDLPYGTTACHWDSIIPFEPLWECYKRIIKDNGAICLFGSQPFTSMLVMSNREMFKYELIWEKNNKTGHLNAKAKPLKIHENILLFSRGSATSTSLTMVYNPQGIIKINKKKKNTSVPYAGERPSRKTGTIFNVTSTNYPDSIIKINLDTMQLHPTQKPVKLYEYLIKTYTNENDLILDNCSGSGTLAIASHNLRRNFICIEKDPEYHRKSVERYNKHILQERIF